MYRLELELAKTAQLTGLNFCLSGSFEKGKDYWENLIQKQGGNCQSSVGKKTDYLVYGPGSGAKKEKADQLGIKAIEVDQLEKLL